MSRELGDSPRLARACLTGLDQNQARRALVLLARASAEHAAARALLESSLARFSDALDTVTAPRGVTIAIADMPAINKAVTAYRALAQARPDAFLPSLAGALNNLSLRLADLGRPTEALTAIEEAVTAYRALVGDRPEVFARRYANSLETRDAILSALGREAEADTSEE